MVALKIRKVGNSLGTTIPQDVAARLKVSEGDSLFLSETPGGYLITPYDPDFEKQMEAARSIMKRRRNVLHELAK